MLTARTKKSIAVIAFIVCLAVIFVSIPTEGNAAPSRFSLTAILAESDTNDLIGNIYNSDDIFVSDVDLISGSGENMAAPMFYLFTDVNFDRSQSMEDYFNSSEIDTLVSSGVVQIATSAAIGTSGYFEVSINDVDDPSKLPTKDGYQLKWEVVGSYFKFSEYPPGVIYEGLALLAVEPYWVAVADASKNSFSVDGGNTQLQNKSFTITASGDRQDATGSAIGETRYIPSDASANPTVNFAQSSGGYSANMTIAKAGTYTLSVNYNLQSWNGTQWVSTSSFDTKTAELKITATSANPGTDDSINILLLIAFCVLSLTGALGFRKIYKRQ